MDSAIVDPPTREVSLRSEAIEVLKDSKSNLRLGFKCCDCHELKWFDPDEQSCSAPVHRIYYDVAVEVVAMHLENVLGWPQGTWNGATSSKMESFHLWMYIYRDRNRSHEDLPGNAGVNRQAHRRRLAKMWNNRTLRKRLGGGKNSEGDSLSKSEPTPSFERTVSEAAPTGVKWSWTQIEAFRKELIEWMRTAPQVDLHGGHHCSSCPKKLWYHPDSCEDQSHSVYNSAAIVVVGEYLERNKCGRIAVEDCHIWQYLKNKSCPPTKHEGIRRRYKKALRERRDHRRRADTRRTHHDNNEA